MFLLRTGPSGTIEDLVPFWFPGTRPVVGGGCAGRGCWSVCREGRWLLTLPPSFGLSVPFPPMTPPR